MKKTLFCLMAIGLSLAFQPAPAKASSPAGSDLTISSSRRDSVKAQALLVRLNEINSMDKGNLKPHDKKDLRREVRSIRQQLREMGGGIYISAGALIVIIILLIILL
jgi:hypothetical protein